MDRCTALIAQGTRCTRPGHIEGLCGTHRAVLLRRGPREFGLNQINVKYNALILTIKLRYENNRQTVTETLQGRARGTELARLKREFNRERLRLEGQKADEIAVLTAALGAAEFQGIDDEGFGAREVALEQEIQDIQAELAALHAGGAAGGELRAFAEDKQNVHTSVMVKQTKDIVETVLKTPVPEGYRWDKIKCSKTPGEIITECELSQKAAWQMVSQYAQDTSIYDMGEGIYGKVLDSAWQFIKSHPEKESLVAILRVEMNDSVGMCAQGNLTRVCNILAGYMDGVGSQESVAEILGRLLPPLRNIKNLDERHARVLDILVKNKVPIPEWDAWVEVVMDE